MRSAVVLLFTLSCQPFGGSGRDRPRPAAAPVLAPAELIGSWRWELRTDEGGTSRTEHEDWQFQPSTTTPGQLVGRYIRTVEVRSSDQMPFGCNQRRVYRQRAMFDVVADLEVDHFAIRETGYHAEPSPCDHGFRRIGDYTATIAQHRLVLRWKGGSQTLVKTSSSSELAPQPWSASPVVTGPWRWQATSYDDKGNIRDEDEQWEITKRTDTRVDATYKRHVTVRSPDGSAITCANAPSWSFDDTYVLEGQREEEHWRFTEIGVEPGDHPCLRPTPHRSLDEATAEQLGDYLVLEWRGKRHEILYRPE